MIGALAVFWNWDWFIPIVESKASAALGRAVTIGHLQVHLGRIVEVDAADVTIANPPDWPTTDAKFATIQTLKIQAGAWDYIRGRGLVLPMIGAAGAKILVAETPSGAANYKFPASGSKGGTPVKIGNVQIADSDAHVAISRLKTDFNARIETRGEGDAAQIVVDAKGRYADQPVAGTLVGGALLSLRDAAHPWPIKLDLVNGPTRIALNGTLRDPLALQGADVRLKLSGPDMALLDRFVGFPIPQTPAYDITGKLILDGLDKIRFEDFEGRLGSSDIGGTIEEQPGGSTEHGQSKPLVTMDLRSRRVDLPDLNGFIGGTPGRATTANATPKEREAAAAARASPKLFPDTPIDVPKLDWADIHLHYHAAAIAGRDMPLDDVTVAMDVVGGRITLHPIGFAIGKGHLTAHVELVPESGKNVHAKVDLRMQNLDLARMMAATHTFQGAGSVSGVGAIDATGNSMASLMANGNGEVKMAMAGGDLSAVLIDLTGLQFGKALLSALGIPDKTPVQCFVGDMALRRGVLDFDAVTLDTGEAIVNVVGNVNLSKETIDLGLKTDSKHFSVGSLPTRLSIGGTFKDPSIRPGAEAVARLGAAVGLGALFLPLAILPTIQFGTSEAADARCGVLLARARAQAGGQALPPASKGPAPAH